MMRFALVVSLCSTLLTAQEPEPAPDAASNLPQANSQEARAMVSQAMDKLAAYGRGKFASTISRDQAMLRNAGLPFGANDTEVDGSWHRDTVWGDYDGRRFVLANGRMLAQQDGEWRLRRDKLSEGVPLPFVLDPSFLIDTLKNCGAAAMVPVHVEAGTLRGKRAVVLTSKLAGDDALELADSGAVPGAGGGMGGIMMFGGLGGQMAPPRPELDTYIAFWVDAESGDLLRLAVKSYSTDEMAGQIRVAVAGAGVGGDEEEEEEEAEETADGKPVWKRGFPVAKPKKDQSVVTFQVDFKDLGLTNAPELDDRSKALLRLR